MDPRFEIIDAFVDGERVDAAALKRVLSDEAGRDYLVDVWLLREGVQEEMASDTSVLAMPPARPRGRGAWLLAAAAAIVCLAAGYLAGYRLGGRPVVTSPGTTSSPAADTRPSASFPVPTPTRVIQIEFSPEPATGRGGD